MTYFSIISWLGGLLGSGNHAEPSKSIPGPPDKPPSFLSGLMGRGEGYDEAFVGYLWPSGELVGTRHL